MVLTVTLAGRIKNHLGDKPLHKSAGKFLNCDNSGGKTSRERGLRYPSGWGPRLCDSFVSLATVDAVRPATSQSCTLFPTMADGIPNCEPSKPAFPRSYFCQLCCNTNMKKNSIPGLRPRLHAFPSLDG